MFELNKVAFTFIQAIIASDAVSTSLSSPFELVIVYEIMVEGRSREPLPCND